MGCLRLNAKVGPVIGCFASTIKLLRALPLNLVRRLKGAMGRPGSGVTGPTPAAVSGMSPQGHARHQRLRRSRLRLPAGAGHRLRCLQSSDWRAHHRCHRRCHRHCRDHYWARTHHWALAFAPTRKAELHIRTIPHAPEASTFTLKAKEASKPQAFDQIPTPATCCETPNPKIWIQGPCHVSVQPLGRFFVLHPAMSHELKAALFLNVLFVLQNKGRCRVLGWRFESPDF